MLNKLCRLWVLKWSHPINITEAVHSFTRQLAAVQKEFTAWTLTNTPTINEAVHTAEWTLIYTVCALIYEEVAVLSHRWLVMYMQTTFSKFKILANSKCFFFFFTSVIELVKWCWGGHTCTVRRLKRLKTISITVFLIKWMYCILVQ